MDVRDYGGGEDSVRTAAHAEVARRQPEKCQGCFSPQKVVQRDEAKGEETRGVAAANAAAECAGKSPPPEPGTGSRDGRSWRRRESNPRKVPAALDRLA
jgi:hypothetical protein